MSTITVSAGVFAPRPRKVATPVRLGTVGRPTPARLTRRGRLVLAALALVLLVVGAVLASGGAPATAGTDRVAAVTAERVTVRPGETLWAIARREAPGVDPRETIARILDLNALESVAVRAGSVLMLPVSR